MSSVQWQGEEWMRTVLLPSVEEGLDAAAQSFRNTIRTSISGPRGSAPGGPPGMDQGTLRLSISINTPSPMRRQIGARTPYALPIERGGIIRSRSGKFMTVPLTDEAKKIRRQNLSLRSVPNLTLIRAKSGRLLLVRQAGRGQTKRTEILFLLTKVVVHEARPFMAPGLVNGKSAAQAAFNRFLTRGLASRRIA